MGPAILLEYLLLVLENALNITQPHLTVNVTCDLESRETSDLAWPEWHLVRYSSVAVMVNVLKQGGLGSGIESLEIIASTVFEDQDQSRAIQPAKNTASI